MRRDLGKDEGNSKEKRIGRWIDGKRRGIGRVESKEGEEGRVTSG